MEISNTIAKQCFEYQFLPLLSRNVVTILAQCLVNFVCCVDNSYDLYDRYFSLLSGFNCCCFAGIWKDNLPLQKQLFDDYAKSKGFDPNDPLAWKSVKHKDFVKFAVCYWS